MSDDLTNMVEKAIRDQAEVFQQVAVAIAPLIEARVREARAEAWDEAAEEAHGWGWLHDWALADVKERNPYRDEASNA